MLFELWLNVYVSCFSLYHARTTESISMNNGVNVPCSRTQHGVIRFQTTEMNCEARFFKVCHVQALIRPRGFKTFFMLNSAEHGI